MTGLRVPDPTGLAAASAMQQLLAPAQIILNGSRAVSEHRPDSGVDLMAVCEDEATLVQVKGKLDSLLEGEPPVHVYAITRAEFQGMAIMAQSFPGQAARYGVTADGQPLNYRPERQPSPVEIGAGADFWKYLCTIELREFQLRAEEKDDRPWTRRTGPLHAQYAMQWAIKRLLYLDNDSVRYRRDIAVMWRYVQSFRPVTMPERIEAVEQLLAATAEPGGEGCLLTAFIHAHRRHLSMPVLGEEQWASLCRHLDPAVNACWTRPRTAVTVAGHLEPIKCEMEKEDIMATDKSAFIPSLVQRDEGGQGIRPAVAGHSRRGGRAGVPDCPAGVGNAG